MLELTFGILSTLTEAEHLDLHRLLGRPPERVMVWLRRTTRPHQTPWVDRVLAYLGEHQLPHPLAKERHWTPQAKRRPYSRAAQRSAGLGACHLARRLVDVAAGHGSQPGGHA